jgi:hypothetical protein
MPPLLHAPIAGLAAADAAAAADGGDARGGCQGAGVGDPAGVVAVTGVVAVPVDVGVTVDVEVVVVTTGEVGGTVGVTLELVGVVVLLLVLLLVLDRALAGLAVLRGGRRVGPLVAVGAVVTALVGAVGSVERSVRDASGCRPSPVDRSWAVPIAGPGRNSRVAARAGAPTTSAAATPTITGRRRYSGRGAR